MIEDIFSELCAFYNHCHVVFALRCGWQVAKLMGSAACAFCPDSPFSQLSFLLLQKLFYGYFSPSPPPPFLPR